METHWLVCHPDTPQDALLGIRVWIGRKGPAHLSIEFRALGDMSRIVWPTDGNNRDGTWIKADDLWKNSCFEMFGRSPGTIEYFEMNFATSGLWASYNFSDYRSGLRKSEVDLAKGVIELRERRTKMMAVVGLPESHLQMELQLGLSAVIEETDGTKSYWALAHPPGAPDFHHPTCFAATLPAPTLP